MKSIKGQSLLDYAICVFLGLVAFIVVLVVFGGPELLAKVAEVVR